MSPSLPQSGKRTVLRGVLTNTSDEAQPGMGITARLSTTRFGSLDGLDGALDLASPLDTVPLPSTSGKISSVVLPAASVPWRIVLGGRALDGLQNGTYVLEIRASGDNSDATARIALPWYDSPLGPEPEGRLALAWLMPLTAAPAMDAAGRLVDREIPEAVAAGGRLTALVEGAKNHPEMLTWVIDPALLQIVESLAAGNTTVAPDGNRDATQAAAAASWLESVRSTTRRPDVGVTPMAYADVDVSSLVGARLGGDVTLSNTMAAEATSRLLGRTTDPVMAWPAGATVPAEVISVLHSAGVRRAQLDRTALSDLPENTDVAQVGGKGGLITAVVGDAALNRTVAGRTSAGEVAGPAQRQLLVAQLSIMANELERERAVIAPGRLWAMDPAVLSEALSAIGDAPWVDAASLAKVIGDKTQLGSPRSLAPVTAKARRRMIPPATLRTIKQQQQLLARFSKILVDPTETTLRLTDAILRSESAAWRRQRDTGARLVESNGSELASMVDRVRPLSGGVVTFAAPNGRVPVTIANDLDVAIRVGIQVEGDPGVRLIQEDPVSVEVPARQKISTQVPAQILGAGELPATVYLTTPDGSRIGEPSHVTLRTTAYAAAAGYVVGLAFVALALAIVISTVKRRRTLARIKANDTPDGA